MGGWQEEAPEKDGKTKRKRLPVQHDREARKKPDKKTIAFASPEVTLKGKIRVRKCNARRQKV